MTLSRRSKPRNQRLGRFVGSRRLLWSRGADRLPTAGTPGALTPCAAPHQIDGRRFHGPVNVIMIDRPLWDGDDQAAAEAS
jgi:hypothetical protein